MGNQRGNFYTNYPNMKKNYNSITYFYKILIGIYCCFWYILFWPGVIFKNLKTNNTCSYVKK